MTTENWLNENCKRDDFSESANQANNYIYTSNVIEYMDKYVELKIEQLEDKLEKEDILREAKKRAIKYIVKLGIGTEYSKVIFEGKTIYISTLANCYAFIKLREGDYIL